MFQNKFCKTKKQVYYKQETGIGGLGRVLLVYPPGRNFFENTPLPGDFG